MSTKPTVLPPRDAVLVEFFAREGVDLLPALRTFAAASGANVQAVQALEEPRVTLYLRGLPPGPDVTHLKSLASVHLGALAEGAIEVSRLQGLRTYAGASAGSPAPWHYVVRTNVVEGGAEDLERWYDEEHMPGLASVPGTVLAQRLISRDAGPFYYACYDLTAPETLGSPPWLAVRASLWSDRVRPTFREPRRIMSRVLDLGAP